MWSGTIAAPTEYTVSVLTSATELSGLAAEWDRLAGDECEPMQSHAWQMAAIRHLHTDAKLRVVIVRAGTELIAAAPLVEVRRHGILWLELPGAAILHEPAGLLATGPEALVALCTALLAQRTPMVLQRLDREGAVNAAIMRLKGRRFFLAAPSGGSCLRVETHGGWTRFQSRLSGSRRNTLQRKRRQLEQMGAVSMQLLVPDPQAAPQALHAAFEVEARSWKSTAGSAVLQTPRSLAFFKDLAQHFAGQRRLEIRLLWVGAAVAASQVGIVRGGRWWELKIGYDPHFARYSPGMLLGWEALRDAFERPLLAHEFLGSSAPWQRPFATGERNLQTLVLYPLTLTGLTALGIDFAAFASGRILAAAGAAVAALTRRRGDLGHAIRQRLAHLRNAWFDWRHGVETTHPVAVAALKDVDPSIAAHAVHYEATSVGKFDRAMGILAPRYAHCTFVDLGSGKGRVLMLAALRPFNRVIGVEISAALHATALANAAEFARRNPRARAVECVCADASQFDLPEGDLVVFLYNPFDAELLERACARVMAAAGRAPREIGLVYVNPVHFEVIERTGRFERLFRDAALAVYRMREPGRPAA